MHERIIGDTKMATTRKSSERASVTETFVKSRVSKPTLGKWCTGFTAAKKYADDNKVPLIAVWSNGDLCGHCTMFETATLNSKFTKWMSTSKCVFWFGYSGDTTADEKHGGAGYKFAKADKLTTYPFVRVWWKAGKVDQAESGDYWIGSSSSGYSTFIKKLESLLAKYISGGGSQTDESSDDCGECACTQEEYDKLKKNVKSLKTKITNLNELAKDVESSVKKLLEAF
jgi:hypothetical protein